jgi:hypothetical protein
LRHRLLVLGENGELLQELYTVQIDIKRKRFLLNEEGNKNEDAVGQRRRPHMCRVFRRPRSPLSLSLSSRRVELIYIPHYKQNCMKLTCTATSKRSTFDRSSALTSRGMILLFIMSVLLQIVVDRRGFRVDRRCGVKYIYL